MAAWGAPSPNPPTTGHDYHWICAWRSQADPRSATNVTYVHCCIEEHAHPARLEHSPISRPPLVNKYGYPASFLRIDNDIVAAYCGRTKRGTAPVDEFKRPLYPKLIDRYPVWEPIEARDQRPKEHLYGSEVSGTEQLEGHVLAPKKFEVQASEQGGGRVTQRQVMAYRVLSDGMKRYYFTVNGGVTWFPKPTDWEPAGHYKTIEDSHNPTIRRARQRYLAQG